MTHLDRLIARTAEVADCIEADADARTRFEQLLTAVITDDVCEATVNPDGEDGFAVEWVAGRRRLFVEVCAENEWAVCACDDEGRLTVNTAGEGLPDFDEVRALIVALTEHVTAVLASRDPTRRRSSPVP